MRYRAIVVMLLLSVALLLLGPTVAGIAIDSMMGTTPLGLAVGVGTGVLLASLSVTRFVLSRIEELAPTSRKEEPSE